MIQHLLDSIIYRPVWAPTVYIKLPALESGRKFKPFPLVYADPFSWISVLSFTLNTNIYLSAGDITPALSPVSLCCSLLKLTCHFLCAYAPCISECSHFCSKGDGRLSNILSISFWSSVILLKYGLPWLPY